MSVKHFWCSLEAEWYQNPLDNILFLHKSYSISMLKRPGLPKQVFKQERPKLCLILYVQNQKDGHHVLFWGPRYPFQLFASRTDQLTTRSNNDACHCNFACDPPRLSGLVTISSPRNHFRTDYWIRGAVDTLRILVDIHADAECFPSRLLQSFLRYIMTFSQCSWRESLTTYTFLSSSMPLLIQHDRVLTRRCSGLILG